MQRNSIRGDGPDEEDADSSRSFGARIYSTGVIDSAIEHEAEEYARSLRGAVMGEDLPPCNCAPESCGCPWGLRRARELLYPNIPCSPLEPEVGVEVGPQLSEDWGVPCDYAASSDPIHWGMAPGEDYYGPEGATVRAGDMYSLTEPDHELLH
jgi:hypothetical protein